SLLQGAEIPKSCRKKEEAVAREQRRVPPTRQSPPPARRKDSQPRDPPVSLSPRATRRSHPEEEKAPVEGSDGEHHAPLIATGSSPTAGGRSKSTGLFFRDSSPLEDRQSRCSVH